MSLKFNAAFWGIVVVQMVLLLSIVGIKEFTLRTGAIVTLQTVPVDPRSLLQGDHVILQYEIATLPPHLRDLPRGTTVYVALIEGEEVWVAQDYLLSHPSSEESFPSDEEIVITGEEVFIKGTVDRPGLLNFGIGSYFVPEGTGHMIERSRDVKVRASVDGRGNAVITEVLVDGKPFNPEAELPTPTP